MAIEITPRTKVKVPAWAIVVAAVLLILFIILTAAYIYIIFSSKKVSKEFEEKNIKVVSLEEATTKKEEELQPINEEINDFSELLVTHKKTLDTFTFLERICLPSVWFFSFDFNPSTGEVNVSGQVDSFVTLEQQINILKQQSALISLNITEILINEEGNINFSFSLVLR